MKVALLNTYLHGGAATACIRHTKALRSLGIDAQILSSSPSEESYINSLQGIAKMRYKFSFYAERLSFLPHEKSKAVRFAYSLANFGASLHKHPVVREADIINLHWVHQGFLSLAQIKALGQLGKPIVWTMHDMWVFTGGCHYAGSCDHYLKNCGNCDFFLKHPKDRDLSNKIWSKKQQVFPQLPLNIVTPSQWLADLAQSSALLSSVPVQAIPNTIDTSLFRPLDKTELRKKHKLPTDKPLVLFMAMKISDERKGFKYLQDALKTIKANHPDLDFELLIAGTANEEDLKAIPYKANYLGHISGEENIMEVYNMADLFVIPSLEDNLPNTIMESLACGTPVVGFETGGIPEMVEHEHTGYIAPYKNAQKLAEGLHWVLNLSDRAYQELSKHCREKVEGEYAYAVIGQRHIDLFESLLSKKK